MKTFLRGLRAGIPIGIGYLAVGFTFGITAETCGVNWWQALLISMTTLTSAGQLAGVFVMANPGQYLEMLISQLTINVRYSFMSMSLSQRATGSFRGIKRWLLGFFITDEIFAVAVAQDELSPVFFGGLAVLPYFGWALGTLLGSLIGNILPQMVLNALCLAIYGMFLAAIAPKARASKAILATVAMAAGLHCLLHYTPVLKEIPLGLAVSICAIAAAVLGALIFPVRDGGEEGDAA